MEMTLIETGNSRAVADLTKGLILATVEIAATPERVFQALTSEEIADWWGRPGVFDTRGWTGNVSVGETWEATGVARGNPYVLQGEFLEVNSPSKLSHSWHPAAAPQAKTTVSYFLEPIAGGTRITLRHSGHDSRITCSNNCVGWETSFNRLAEILADEESGA